MRGVPGGGEGPPASRRFPLVILGMSAVATLSWLTVAQPYPSLLSPYSLTVVIPYWFAGPVAAFSLHPLLYLIATSGLVAGRLRRPWPAALIFLAFEPLSLFFTVWGIRPGIRHYGAGHALGILGVNLAAGAAIALALALAFRRPAILRLVALHTLLWGWVAWSGLPWLRQLL